MNLARASFLITCDTAKIKYVDKIMKFPSDQWGEGPRVIFRLYGQRQGYNEKRFKLYPMVQSYSPHAT